jgi:mRNA-degrading endonuclease RelE of RelBE toxin-antitoxin system
MKRIVPLPSFERSVQRLPPGDRRKIAVALEKLNAFILSGSLSAGLGLKKLYAHTYEIRAGIRLRIILKVFDEMFYLVIVGDHDDIARHAKDDR